MRFANSVLMPSTPSSSASAARETPRAEAAEPEPVGQPVAESQPALQAAAEALPKRPDPAAMEAAVRLLELPASPAGTGG